MALRKPSYRIRKWSRSSKGFRDYITYLIQNKKYGTMGGDNSGVPETAMLDSDYEPMLDSDGAYMTE